MRLRAVFLLAVLGFPYAGTATAGETLRLATTTSLENSGLLAHLLPTFQRATGIVVEVLPTGSGKALKLAENGDVDVVLSHAPRLEQEYARRGAVVDATPVMFNEFVLVGPPEDPASVAGLSSMTEALRRIAATRALFFSRGDDSGTHEKEQELWQEVGIVPQAPWHLQTGQGMGATLRIAYERRGYTLCDTGTFAQFRGKGDLRILVRPNPPLRNLYSVLATNPARFPSARSDLARKWIEWLVSPEGQRAIAAFPAPGQALFHPIHLEPAAEAGCTRTTTNGCVPTP